MAMTTRSDEEGSPIHLGSPHFPFSCPVIQEAQKALKASEDLRKTMRRLRKKLNYCTSCDLEGHCPVIQEIQQMITTAIAELTDEWQLIP